MHAVDMGGPGDGELNRKVHGNLETQRFSLGLLSPRFWVIFSAGRISDGGMIGLKHEGCMDMHLRSSKQLHRYAPHILFMRSYPTSHRWSYHSGYDSLNRGCRRFEHPITSPSRRQWGEEWKRGAVGGFVQRLPEIVRPLQPRSTLTRLAAVLSADHVPGIRMIEACLLSIMDPVDLGIIANGFSQILIVTSGKFS